MLTGSAAGCLLFTSKNQPRGFPGGQVLEGLGSSDLQRCPRWAPLVGSEFPVSRGVHVRAYSGWISWLVRAALGSGDMQATPRP